MANYSLIQQTLNSYLSTMENLPDWKRENKSFTPKEEELFIESKLIPAETGYPNIGVNGFEVESGTFAIKVKTVRYQSWGSYSAVVDNLLNHFERNTELTDPNDTLNVTITKSYALNGFDDSDGRYTIPVHVRYDSYVCY